MIDFNFFFIYILGKRKMTSYYLKKFDVYVLSIVYYYTKTNNGNNNFILTIIMIVF